MTDRQTEIADKFLKFLAENDEVNTDQYASSIVDRFSEDELEMMRAKLDELANKLAKLELGQQITYDDLMDELKEMKDLLYVLTKKNWKQLLKGKLLDAGFGVFAEDVGDVVLDVFKDNYLLNK